MKIKFAYVDYALYLSTMKRELTKGDVYVVVDTPKKAKKLKRLLDMFGQKIFSINSIDVGYDLAYDESDESWYNKSIDYRKELWYDEVQRKEVSIKELKQILAKEHLKEGDWIIAKCSGTDTEYLVKVDEIYHHVITGRYSFMSDSDNKWEKLSDYAGAFVKFKRYATPEEIALLEPEQNELEVGKWYLYLGHKIAKNPLMLITQKK